MYLKIANRVVALNVKNWFNMRVNERDLGRFPFCPKRRRGHFKHHVCLTVGWFDNDIQRQIRRSSGRIRQKKNPPFPVGTELPQSPLWTNRPWYELYCRNEQNRTYDGVWTSVVSVVLHAGCVIVCLCRGVEGVCERVTQVLSRLEWLTTPVTKPST